MTGALMCGMIIGGLLLVIGALVFWVVLTHASLTQARLELEQNDYDWREAWSKYQRRVGRRGPGPDEMRDGQ